MNLDLFVLLSRAGTNVVMHKDSLWRQKWQDFKDNNPLLKGNKWTSCWSSYPYPYPYSYSCPYSCPYSYSSSFSDDVGAFEMKRAYDESNNIFIYYTRSLTNAIGDTFQSFFQENETAQVIKEITQLDPAFKIEKFLKDAREYIIPEILEAFLKADLATLHPWTGEAVSGTLSCTATCRQALFGQRPICWLVISFD